MMNAYDNLVDKIETLENYRLDCLGQLDDDELVITRSHMCAVTQDAKRARYLNIKGEMVASVKDLIRGHIKRIEDEIRVLGDRLEAVDSMLINGI